MVNQEYHDFDVDISVTLKIEVGVLKPQMLYTEVAQFRLFLSMLNNFVLYIYIVYFASTAAK